MARKLRSRKRRAITGVAPQPQADIANKSSFAPMAQAMEARARTIDIPRQLIRHITESHWSDGTIEKSDRSYPVKTTQTVYS